MDSFELNKIIAAVLMVALLVIGIGKLSDVIFHVEKPEKPGYLVELSQESTASISKETSVEEKIDIAALMAMGDVVLGEKIDFDGAPLLNDEVDFDLLKLVLNLYIKYLLSSVILVPIIILLLSQPDLGQTLLIISVWLAIIFVSGINLLLFAISLLAVGSLTLFLVFLVPKFEYIRIRLMSFLDNSSGNNYQADKASDAISSGSFFGKGIGEGTLNSRIPEAHTDYIISVIAEEFGVIILIGIILLYLVLSYRVLKKINFTKNNNFKLILVGSISIILLQTFIHIGVNIRMLPTTGMTMPFISYGGSSIVGTSILTGIILNLTKRKLN